MEAEFKTNFVSLRGIASAPEFSHESHGRRYFSFVLQVSRLSGAWDAINVIARGDTLAACPFAQGDRLRVSGQLRSYNNKSGRGSRLVITVLAADIERAENGFENSVLLLGALCKPPIYRKTPLGREICDLMLAVNRPYGRVDYLPCIVWGENARFCADMLVGDRLEISGRIQSRTYIKVTDGESEERTAFEVSAVAVSQLLK